MIAPPVVNLLVIRSKDIDRAVTFYEVIGFVFQKHSHGSGPEHYASEKDGFVFEIYPLSPKQEPTIWTRLGFSVDDVDGLVDKLVGLGINIVSHPTDSEWGRRAVVKDIDGHTCEITQPIHAEQGGARQPATRRESEIYGD
ncbi:MAG: VOC family protein [Verrucomicrobiales bacterium]